VNCIGKIRLAGWISRPEQARADNPMDYLVHIKKIALPLFPQYGLEPNIYYIPPIHVPDSFNRQLFGPRAAEAVKTYRNAFNDRDLAGLLCLFGSTERMVSRFNRQGDIITGMDDSGASVIRVPMNEPVHIRPAQDPRNQLVRINCP
jgi:nitrate reductase / nitrite oxidoreductase, beta subunit